MPPATPPAIPSDAILRHAIRLAETAADFSDLREWFPHFKEKHARLAVQLAEERRQQDIDRQAEIQLLHAQDPPQLYFDNVIKTVKHARRSTKKPVFIIMPEISYEAETINNRQVFLTNNIPVFPNVRRAVAALRNIARYAQLNEKQQ